MEQEIEEERRSNNSRWVFDNPSEFSEQISEHITKTVEKTAEREGLKVCLCDEFKGVQKVIPTSDKRRYCDKEEIEKRLLEWRGLPN